MKLKLTPFLLSLCLAILPATLCADNKTVTEADAAAPISINKGDTLTFLLSNAGWTYSTLVGIFSDAAIPANDSKATLLSWASTGTTTTPTGSSITVTFTASNGGQMVLLFTQTGADTVFKYEKAVTFIINIKDPTVAK